MGIIEVKVQIAKETNDIFVAMIKLLKDMKAGKNILEILTGSFKELSDAVEGADDIDNEIAENIEAVMKTLGLGLGSLGGVMLAKKNKPESKPPNDGEVI